VCVFLTCVSFDVTGGVAMTYGDCAAVFSKVLNRPVEYVELSEERMLQVRTHTPVPQQKSMDTHNTTLRDAAAEYVT